MYEDPNQMTPFFPERTANLEELALEVVQKSSELGGRLHAVTRQQLVEFLRITNSYYSNLIEGHNTHPVDIERALRKDYLDDPFKRLLQIESWIHIEVQKQIELRLLDIKVQICSEDFIYSIHELFYEKLPEELKKVKNEE
ncbi:Fic family protein, partial [bacterium]|nr:Fic family protein [bacterium]